MNLSAYLAKERGRQSQLAKAIGAHAPDLSRWADGSRPIPIHFAVAIERETKGEVTRVELFPDTWDRYWPELAQKPRTTSDRRSGTDRRKKEAA